MYVGTATATSADKPTSNCPSHPLGEYIKPNNVFCKQISFNVVAHDIVQTLLYYLRSTNPVSLFNASLLKDILKSI